MKATRGQMARALAELGLRLLYFLPPMAAAALLGVVPDRPFPLGASFALLAAWARLAGLAAKGRRLEELMLYAEALPFLAFAASAWAGASPALVIQGCAEACLSCAALLSLEGLVTRKRGVAETGLFIASLAAIGLAMEALSPAYVLGTAILVLVASLYAKASRRGFREAARPRG